MSRPKRNAWMALYVGDYLRDTSRLTTEQHGAYLLLIMDYFINGPLPDDDEALAMVSKLGASAWKKARPTIERYFSLKDGKWNHKRVDEERMKALAITELRGAAGKEGAERRWQSDSKQIANATSEPLANAWQTDAPSQSPNLKSSSESGSAREAACVANAPRPRREGSVSKTSSFTSEIIRKTLQAAAK